MEGGREDVDMRKNVSQKRKEVLSKACHLPVLTY